MNLRRASFAAVVLALQMGCDAILPEEAGAGGRASTLQAVTPDWCLPQKVSFDPTGRGWLIVSGEIATPRPGDEEAYGFVAQPVDRLSGGEPDASQAIGYLASDTDQILWRPDGRALWRASRDRVIEYGHGSAPPVDITPARLVGLRQCPASITLKYPESLPAGALPLCRVMDGDGGPQLGLATTAAGKAGFRPIGWPATPPTAHERLELTLDAAGLVVGAAFYGLQKLEAIQFPGGAVVALGETDSRSYVAWVRDRKGRSVALTDSPPANLKAGETAALIWEGDRLVVTDRIGRDQPTLRFATVRNSAGVEQLSGLRDAVLWSPTHPDTVRATVPGYAALSDRSLSLQVRQDGRPSVVEERAGTRRETSLACPPDRNYDSAERVLLTAGAPEPLTAWIYGRADQPQAPLAVVLHGGPRSHAAPDSPPPEAVFMLARGYQVLAVNYAGSTGAGMALRRSLYHRQRASGAEALAAALDWTATQSRSPGYRPVLMAGSYGAYLTALNPVYFDRFHTVILSSGVYDPSETDTPLQQLTADYDNLFRDPAGRLVSPFDSDMKAVSGVNILILHGAKDRKTRPGDAARYADFLRARGVGASLRTVQGADHADLLFKRFEPDIVPAATTALDGAPAFRRR